MKICNMTVKKKKNNANLDVYCNLIPLSKPMFAFKIFKVTFFFFISTLFACHQRCKFYRNSTFLYDNKALLYFDDIPYCTSTYSWKKNAFYHTVVPPTAFTLVCGSLFICHEIFTPRDDFWYIIRFGDVWFSQIKQSVPYWIQLLYTYQCAACNIRICR